MEPSRITLSSDANASLPQFDEARRFVGLRAGRLGSLFEVLGQCINDHGIPLERAIGVASTHAADALKLPRKGRLQVGSDADLLVLAEDEWATDEVWAMGRRVYRRG
ncbi:Isoaspartyl dipeptidase [Halomonas chromatireducens]|uniref:Isoaspartyl dipeptidase n=1 Tax=Halomonas chromatireducens TaxID=507626 RepID=A0A109UMS8_9GAMM|nr:amidohydrolase family protein [Halomonas chromatireducens]AMD02076.1 Isoaspartyl dipeptidase [Halomonas chromatireducens]